MSELEVQSSRSNDATECCDFSHELKEALLYFIDADFGLLECLRADLKRQYDLMHRSHDRNAELMNCVHNLRKDRFFNALQKTSQQHVVNYIKQQQRQQMCDTVDPKCFPLTEKQYSFLTENMYDLTNLINFDPLLDKIFAAKCITLRHHEHIKELKSSYDRATCFVSILMKRSQVDYENVSNVLEEDACLKEIGRSFREGGGILSTHVALNEANPATLEAQLETRFREWTERASEEERRELLAKWSELGDDTKLIAMKKSNSVTVYIHLTSSSAVERLNRSREDGKLKSVLEAVFSALLKERRCEITDIQWDASDYERCLNYFRKSMKPLGPTTSTTTPTSSATTATITSATTSVSSTTDSATGMRTAAATTLQASAGSKSTTTIDTSTEGATTTDDVFTTSAYEQQLIVVSEGRTGDVSGLTVHGDELFVVRCEPKSLIEVYNMTSLTFKRIMKLKELETGQVNGLTSCDSNNCLYVSHWYTGSVGFIIRVELTDDSEVMKWKVKDGSYEPEGLSVNSEHNLVVACSGKRKPHRLLEYTTRGEKVREICLKDDVVNPRHAIQLDNSQFLVSHCGERASSLHRVCLVDVNGHVLFSYGNKPGSGTGQLNQPQHLAVDGSNGCIFVADCDNSRIVVLDRTLKRSRDLQIGGGDRVQQPYSLYFDELQHHMLFVGEHNGDESRVVAVDRRHSKKSAVQPH